MALEDGLSAAEAGALIKLRRKERGLTQEQLVEQTGLSSQSYLSALEKGRYHIGRSEHFGAVAQVLRLSEEDIRAINPAAVITVAAPTPAPISEASRRLSAGSKYGRVPRAEVTIPHELEQAAAEYGHLPIYKELRSRRVQEWMIGSVSRLRTPSTVEGWLSEFSDLKRMGYIREDEP